MSDQVNHPAHYCLGGIEVIDAIEAWELPYHLGNVVKYIARAKHKGDPLTDLRKAQWYLNRFIERIEQGHDGSEGDDVEVPSSDLLELLDHPHTDLVAVFHHVSGEFRLKLEWVSPDGMGGGVEGFTADMLEAVLAKALAWVETTGTDGSVPEQTQ